MTVIDVPESLLRTIWRRQRFTTTRLTTSAGALVSILSPGTLNTDAGPDFLDARIRVGRVTYSGDIELHRDAASWQSHRHDKDPHYNRVILHVVLTADEPAPVAVTASRRPVPLLILHPFLDPELFSQLQSSLFDDEGQRIHTLPCAPWNKHVPAVTITQLLRRLARDRIEMKLSRLDDRLRQLVNESRKFVREPYPRYYGSPGEIPPPHAEYTRKDFAPKILWEQLLYEALMESLGYSKNREPFRVLSSSIRLEHLRAHRLSDTETMMALLFGAAGLLPSSRGLAEKESRLYVRSLRKRWKELRPLVRVPLVHSGEWMFFRLRPVNFPTARLAAFCYLLPSLFGDESFRQIVSVFKEEPSGASARRKRLHDLFAFEPEGFWRNHYHFRGTRETGRIAIGAGRVDDMIVNAVVPVALLYGRIFADQAVRSGALDLFERMPPLQENSITRAVQRQLPNSSGLPGSALLQQGAIQLYRCYCSQRRCAECAIGKTIAGTGTPAWL